MVPRLKTIASGHMESLVSSRVFFHAFFLSSWTVGHRKLAQWLVAASLADPTQPQHDLHVKDPWALAVLSIAVLEKHVHVMRTVTCICTAKTQGHPGSNP